MKAIKVWFEKERIYIDTDDGRTLWQSMWYYDKLCRASEEERMRFELEETGIRWKELDEDVTYESFEYEDPEPMDVPGAFLLHPEINPSGVAKRIGMSEELMEKYAQGLERPSIEDEMLILDELRKIGEELCWL